VITWATWPDVAALATEGPGETAFMRRYEERRAADASLPALRHRWVADADISLHVRRAFVSAEDMEFFHHDGFSTSELGVALREALSGERFRGASTITQQLAKNVWLSPSRNPMRKVREVLLTRALEKHLTKRRILELYMNVVELGPGIYGVGAASEGYFGLSAVALGERDAAMLAASLPRPSSWHPGVEGRAYAAYVDDIVGRMGRADFLWRLVD
jgi:monofunctional biosynthetic peptidoglycan transglycosylase